MLIKIVKTIEVEAKTIEVSVGVRYWDDSAVNDSNDAVNGDNVPCKVGDRWCPVIDIETGKILNWEYGKTAEIHYKVSDDGNYKIKDSEGNVIIDKNCYVPDFMSIDDEGYGDYVIMKIDENGIIENWNTSTIQDWTEKEGF